MTFLVFQYFVFVFGFVHFFLQFLFAHIANNIRTYTLKKNAFAILGTF